MNRRQAFNRPPAGADNLGSRLAGSIHVLHGLIGALVLAALFYAHHTSVRTVERNLPLVETTLELRLALTDAHLWFEEYMAGDPSVSMESVLAKLDEADEYARAMLEGGAIPHRTGTFPALSRPDLRQEIGILRAEMRNFRALTLERVSMGAAATAGSKPDEHYDRAFARLVAQAEKVEDILRRTIQTDSTRFSAIVQLVMLAVAGLITSLILLQRRFLRLKDTSLQFEARAKRDAEAKERQLATTLEAMGDGVITTDKYGRVTYVNPAAQELLEAGMADLLDAPADDVLNLMDEDKGNARLTPVKDVLYTVSEKENPGATVSLRGRNGTLRPIVFRATPIPSPSGHMLGVVVLVKDITQQKRVENEARAANRAKSEFLANMSHELRTPISGVLGMTDLLLRDETDSLKRRHMSLVRRSAQSLLSIINDILDLAKVESGKMRMEEAPFSLNETLDTVLRSFAIPALEKGLELSQNLDNVPDRLIGDAGRLEQVLRNLLSNAIKFTESGSMRLEVSSSQAADNTLMLRFSVSDTGMGIPRDRMGDLFQSFTQLDASYSKKYAGTGLGLAICKELANLMGGQISVRSTYGKGSTFVFTARFRPDDTPQLSPTPPKPALQLKTPLRVLVAEDDPTNRMFVEHLLLADGHTVTLVGNGRKAIEALKNDQYDLVLMDVQMPEISGVEATQRIRTDETGELNPNVPIVALTAYAMKGDREKFLASGMDGYIAKPVDPDTFQEAMLEALSRRAADLVTVEGPEPKP